MEEMYRQGNRGMECISTLPLNLYLKQCRHPVDGYEVWSLQDIPIGVRFGPYEETFIDMSGNDKIEDFQRQVETIKKENMILDGRSENKTNWLPYVNYAHHKEESNMITFRTEWGVYYITSRSIPANTELLIHDQYNNIEEEGEGKTAVKKTKTILSNQQLLRLEQEFARNHYLTQGQRSSLADELQICALKIRKWFQNRRRKEIKFSQEGVACQTNGQKKKNKDKTSNRQQELCKISPLNIQINGNLSQVNPSLVPTTILILNWEQPRNSL